MLQYSLQSVSATRHACGHRMSLTMASRPTATRLLRLASALTRRPTRAAVPSVVTVTAAATTDAPAATGKAAARAQASSFAQLGLSRDLLAALDAQQLVKPTEIQALAVPAILQGGDYLLASHTGSGKTLAYLLPLVQKLKEQEGAEGFVPRPKRPRALILGPTKELTQQITRVAKSLCHTAKFRAVNVSGATGQKQQRDALAGPIDMVIGTPTRFLQHLEQEHVHYGDVQWLVIDEADTMFDAGFGPEVTRILAPLRSKPGGCRVVLVSATMSKAVRKLVAEQLPGLTPLETSSLHRAVVGSRHEFVSLPGGQDKLQLLMEVIQGDVRRNRKLLVFCSSMNSCRAVEHYLREQGLPTVCYHGDMPVAARKDAMAQFAAPTTEVNGSGGAAAGIPLQPVMVCTDLAARGLDFPGAVDHVINFDFPLNPIDYLHRTGRTARAGHAGRITSLYTKRERTIANRIEWALQRNEPLDALTNDKSILPPSQQQQQQRPERPRMVVRTGGRPGIRLGLKPRGGSSSSSSSSKAGPRTGMGSGSSKSGPKGPSASSSGARGASGKAAVPSARGIRGAERQELLKQRQMEALERKRTKINKRKRLKGKL